MVTKRWIFIFHDYRSTWLNKIRSPIMCCAPAYSFHFALFKRKRNKYIPKKVYSLHQLKSKQNTLFFPYFLNINFPIHLLAVWGFHFNTFYLVRFIHRRRRPFVICSYVFVSCTGVCVFFFLWPFYSSRHNISCWPFFIMCVYYYYHKINSLPAWYHPFLIEISRLHESMKKIRWPGKFSICCYICQK